MPRLPIFPLKYMLSIAGMCTVYRSSRKATPSSSLATFRTNTMSTTTTTTTMANIELIAVQQPITNSPLQQITEAGPENEPAGQSLPPVDGGKAAWRLLCAAFVFEALLWGFPLSFGVFQNYYSRLPEFEHSPYISVIGTVASGMSYMAAPVMISVIKRFKRYRGTMIYFGCTLGPRTRAGALLITA